MMNNTRHLLKQVSAYVPFVGCVYFKKQIHNWFHATRVFSFA